MELKPGYKQTDVGVIPVDWEVCKLGEKATFRTGPFGSALHKSDYTDDGVPVINPMHIVDGHIVPTRTMSVTEDSAKQLNDFKLRLGDIIIGRRGDMGRCAVVREEEEGWLCGTGSLIIRCAEGVAPDFLQRVLSSPKVVSAIEDTAVGTTMINLNQSVLAGLNIQFPSSEEQRVIAAALSDVNSLISYLDQLIAKKRDIKQGAMQELLIGKKRLPGFTEPWDINALGEVADIDPENLGSETSPDYSFKYISLEDVDNGTLRGTTDQVFRTAPSRARRKLRKGDILVSTVRPNLKSHLYIREDVCDTVGSTGFSVVRCKSASAHPSYVYFHLFADSVERQIEALLTGSNYPAINSGDVKALRIPVPPLFEQIAIAEILSDTDAEIERLEQRRDKTRAIKQGMMQELLTGQKRLI